VGTRERGARRPPRAEGRGRVGRDARRRGGRRRDGPGPPRSRRGRGRDDRTRPHRLDRGPTGRPRRRGNSFETIVGSGPNGAKPHHGCGDREIRAGEPVVLDFGTRVDGYPSDQTRTLVFDGEPPAEYERVHETVRAAQAAAVEAVEPGVAAEAIDRAARDVIEDAGYGDAFFHRTGHGVGLDVHEEPYIVAGNDRELEPGMVFSVEPGIYLDGRFGCRIEDLVVVTEDGCERLNDTDRGWR